jgi:hypothetical protein
MGIVTKFLKVFVLYSLIAQLIGGVAGAVIMSVLNLSSQVGMTVAGVLMLVIWFILIFR